MAAAAAIAITKLATGSTGQIIVVRGSTPTWVSPGSLYAEVTTAETTTSATYVDLTTTGPSITVPTSGDYLISFGATITDGSANANRVFFAAVKLGAAATADAEGLQMSGFSGGGGGFALSLAREIKRTLTASDVIKLQYRSDGAGTASYKNRWLRLEAA